MEENPPVQKEEKNLKNFLFGWVKDNYDKYFLLILAFAFVLRVWIFTKTMNQPVWWDEADYLSAAKNLGLGLDIQDIWYYRRGFLFALLSAPFFTLGIGEIGIRFMGVLFSTGFIFASYLLIGKMFDKKLALYASIGLSFSWIILFFTGRIMTDIPAAFFILLSFLFLWKGYILKEGDKFLYISGAVFALAVLTRMQSLMMVPAFMVPIFLKEKFKMFANKKIWIGVLIFLIFLSPQIYLYSRHYGNPISDLASHYLGIGEQTQATGNERTMFTSEILKYIFNLPYMLSPWLLFLFIPSLFIFFSDLILGFDKIFQSEKLQNKFVALFWILCVFLVIGYINQVDPENYVDQRYIAAALPFLFLICASTLVKMEDFFGKNPESKKTIKLAVIGIFVLLLLPNFFLAKNLLEEKDNSYSEVKQAGLWIKENSNPNDTIISSSVPQITYYSERSTYPYDPGFYFGKKLGFEKFLIYSEDEEGFIEFVKEKKPRYLVFSFMEQRQNPAPDWFIKYLQTNANLVPIKSYEQGGQPVLIIYEFNWDDSTLS